MLKELGTHIAIYGGADLAFRFIGFAVFPIYANIFSVREFGTYALLSASSAIVALVANLGLANAVQRYYWDPKLGCEDRARLVATGLGTLVCWSCAVVLGLVVVLYPMKEVIAIRYGISWGLLVIALFTVVPEQITQYCLDTLRLRFAPGTFVIVSLAKNLLGVTIGLTLIVEFHAGVIGLFIGALAGALIAAPISVFAIRRHLIWTVDKRMARQLAHFGYPFVFVGLAYWVFGSSDRWMLAELADMAELGLYAIAFKFAGVIGFLNSAFGQAWSPVALRLWREKGDYRYIYARVLSQWFFLLLLVGAVVCVFGPELLQMLTPPAYWSASPILAVLVMGLVIYGTTQITAIGISLERKTRLFAIGSWITAVVNVVLNVALIKNFGARGAALATFLSYALLTALYLLWSQKLHPIPFEKRGAVYCAVVAALFATVFGGFLVPTTLTVGVPLKIALIMLLIAGAFALGIVDFRSARAVDLGRRPS